MSTAGGCEVDWASSAVEAAARFGTPCYLFSWRSVLGALDALTSLELEVPVRHWLSMKTQPLRRVLREWRILGLGVEVVSEFELRAALEEGFSPDRILVNGVAKHQWLGDIPVAGLRVHFDSLEEIKQLASTCLRRHWRVGIRFALKEQFDPDEPKFGTQFGMSYAEARSAITELREIGVEPESAHFHLRSNVRDSAVYGLALQDLSIACQQVDLRPRFLDCGGGLPCPGESVERDLTPPFEIANFADILLQAAKTFDSVQEIWLENGRFITSRAGALILRVTDVKERPECRYVICDGGRTNHALVSDWERHGILTVPTRPGALRLTTVCGPTCMAYDRLVRLELPCDLCVGDLVIWKNAGAYHIPWETRFSHGHAPVVWIDQDGKLSTARERQTFESWWQLM